MKHRIATSLVAAAVASGAMIAVLSAPVAGQAPAPTAKWTPPRTPDGHIDFSGLWTYAAGTPGDVPLETGGNVRDFPQLAEEGFTMKDHGTAKSLVVDPPDGKIPLKHEAEVARDYDFAHIGESWIYLTPWERCISRGMPGSMIPANYNNSYLIVQNADNVAILHEMIHETRIIPTDGSPHLPQSIRLWLGDPRGHWEGDTLVIESTNFTDKGDIAHSGANGRMRGVRHSDKLHVVERFTLTGPDTIWWEGTVEDPENYTAPWKVAFKLDRNNQYHQFEYACHEGNYTVPNSLIKGPEDPRNAAKK